MRRTRFSVCESLQDTLYSLLGGSCDHADHCQEAFSICVTRARLSCFPGFRNRTSIRGPITSACGKCAAAAPKRKAMWSAVVVPSCPVEAAEF